MKKISVFSIAAVLLCWSSVFSAGEDARPGVGVTIYNNDFGVVKERRLIHFSKGLNKVKFTEVASAIDPTTVNFQCLTAPGAVAILEQNYEYDLVSTESLLKRYIDGQVCVEIRGSGADPGKAIEGILLASMDRNLIVRPPTGEVEIISTDAVEQVKLTKLPEDLVTRPTLNWLAESAKEGQLLCQVTYTTGQITWSADYSAVLNADESKIDLSGWVTIDNKSGTAYKDAVIKLIAGDVRRVVEERLKLRDKGVLLMEARVPRAAGFEEKPFMEYHLYTLGRASTINNNQVKQIELMPTAAEVPVKKLYIYDRQEKDDKVQIKFEFENTQENHLGIPLPKGKVRVFKKDPADGMLEFVGEDRIDHTAKKEKLLLYIGDAFDVVPEYTLMDSKRERRKICETHKVELRNRKDTAVSVNVDEKFPAWVNWQIDESSQKYEKRDARTARFQIDVPADSVVILQYTATQTW
ncbi:MAG: hypothetical protein ABIG61_13895 [Planctomycetota bacterium]